MRAGVEFIDNVHQDQFAALCRLSGTCARQPSLVDAACGLRSGRDQARRAGSSSMPGFATTATRSSIAGHAARGADLPALVHAIGEVPVRQRLSSAERLRAEYRLLRPQVDDLRPESIDTHELVWERYVNDWLRTSVSTYWYKADRLITGVADDSTVVWASRSSIRDRCGRRDSSSKRRCASKENRGRW